MSSAQSIPLRPSGIPDGWISAVEAAARSGRSLRTIQLRCTGWMLLGNARKAGGLWFINPAVCPDFARPPGQTPGADRSADLLELPASKRRGAMLRRQILSDLESYITARLRDGIGRIAAMREFVETRRGLYGIRFSVRTLHLWQRAAKDAPVTGLVDRRGLNPGGSPDPPEEARRQFERLYLTGNRVSASAAFREMRYWCDHRGLWWFASLSSQRRWVERTYPLPMRVLNRDGYDAYRQRCEPFHELDPEAYAGGECYVGDHHEFRNMVRHHGRLIRPWLTAWIDYRSQTLVGWVVCESPNQTTILESYRRACLRFGPSEIAMTDNGRDYRSYALTGAVRIHSRTVLAAGYLDEPEVAGLFNLLGTRAVFVMKRSPNSKPIEGWFRPIEERFCRRLPNYCGADPKDRPHDFADRIRRHPESFPTLEEFARDVGRWIEQCWNAQPHGGKYCAGRSPLEVLAATRRSEPRMADPKVLELLSLVWARPLTVGRNGISLNGIRYGQFDPEILAMQGQTVRVSYDPSDISSIGVWDMNFRWICRAPANELRSRTAEPVTDRDSRERHRIRRRIRKAITIAREEGDLAYRSSAELTLAAQSARLEAQERQARVPSAREADGGEAPEITEPRLIRLIQTPLDGQSSAMRSQAASGPRGAAPAMRLDELGVDDSPAPRQAGPMRLEELD